MIALLEIRGLERTPRPVSTMWYDEWRSVNMFPVKCFISDFHVEPREDDSARSPPFVNNLSFVRTAVKHAWARVGSP